MVNSNESRASVGSSGSVLSGSEFPNVGHPPQFAILTMHAVRHCRASPEKAFAADRGTWQELAVVGVEVRLDFEQALDSVYLSDLSPRIRR